jgi:hypothetical protein
MIVIVSNDKMAFSFHHKKMVPSGTNKGGGGGIATYIYL